jgi:subtilase family serine protease
MSMNTVGQRLAAVVVASLLLSVVGAPPAAAGAPSWSHRDAHVCGQAAAGQARCTSVARAFYLDGVEFDARTASDLATAAAAAQATWYSGTSIRTAYGITAQGDPSRVVAIVDAYDDPNAFADLTRFRSDSGLPEIQGCTLATLTSLTSSASSPCFAKTNQTGGTSLPSADAGWSNEIDLDLQAASAVCPMCSILLLEATSASVGNLGTAVTTASNTAHVLAISNSYGISGDYPGSLAPAYDTAAKKGIAVTASAGDGGYGVLFPASATNVIGVGGTTLSVGATGVRTAETAWAGTGSGCSVYNTAPAWQSIPGNPCAGKKAVADLSADADPNSGLAIYTTYSGVTGYWVFGGTSLSSPLIATLYAMQGGYNASTLAGQYAWAAGTPYYDVTSGSNGTCSPSVLCTARVGWDGPTGRGSILTTSAQPPNDFSISASPSSLSVAQGAARTSTISTALVSGSAESITLSASGLPSGVTAGFSANPVSAGGSSTLTLTASGSATLGGPVTVTITGTAASATHTTSVSLTVTAAVSNDFSISASPSTLSVAQGAAGTSTISTAVVSGSGSVALTLAPAPPSGVTAIFNPTPVAAGSSSTLTFTVSGSATPGTYPFSVTGIEGTATHSLTVSLTVTAVPDFLLSVNPTAKSVSRGGTATYTVTITPANGFNGSVTLSLSGQPSGSTVTFTPNPATGTSTLTIRTRSATSRQTYTLTIKGVSGSLSHSTSASLTVTK